MSFLSSDVEASQDLISSQAFNSSHPQDSTQRPVPPSLRLVGNSKYVVYESSKPYSDDFMSWWKQTSYGRNILVLKRPGNPK